MTVSLATARLLCVRNAAALLTIAKLMSLVLDIGMAISLPNTKKTNTQLAGAVIGAGDMRPY